MIINAFGINHKTAPIALREQVAFNSGQLPEALKKLTSIAEIKEAVILSTCNRTEIYTISEQLPSLTQWLSALHSLQPAELKTYCYTFQDIHAVRHLLRVASGLDSMIIGEPQILGQLKTAYAIACESGAVGAQLKHLFPAVFNISKSIRTDTAIGHHAVTLPFAITQLAQQLFSDLHKCRLLLVGAGETIELVATHLHDKVAQLMIANRSHEKSEALVRQFGGQAIYLNDIPAHLKEADVVVSATSSQLPILGKGAIETALKARKRRPILMADLAVPRDIEDEARQLEDVYLYNIDDLQQIVAQNLQSRQQAAEQAEMMISLQAEHYMRQLKVLDAGQIIHHYRQQVDQLRDRELQQALKRLQAGQNPEAALAELAHHLTHKLMHQPTVALRKAAYDGRLDVLHSLQALFCPSDKVK